jgi:hypothetical protein
MIREHASRGRGALALAALLLLACGSVLPGCASEDVQIVNDPFVGPMRSFSIGLPGGGYMDMQGISVREAQGRFSLMVTVMQGGDSLSVAHVGDPGEFKVGDQIVALTNAAEARPNARPFGNGVVTQWQLTYALDDAQAKQMASGPLTAFKVQVGSEVHQVSLSSGKAEKFHSNMALMTSR